MLNRRIQKIWTSGQCPKDLTQALIIPLLKKATYDLPELQNDEPDRPRKHGHARAILNRLVNQAEQILEAEQSGFRSQRIDVHTNSHKESQVIWIFMVRLL